MLYWLHPSPSFSREYLQISEKCKYQGRRGVIKDDYKGVSVGVKGYN